MHRLLSTMRPRLVLLMLTACGHPGDAHLYREAVRERPARAAELCRDIGATPLRDECLAFAARSAVEIGDASLGAALCKEVVTPKWHDECIFMCSDVGNLTAEEAGAACANAGRYALLCRNHALQRGVDSVLMELDIIGREEELTEEFRRVVQETSPPAGSEGRPPGGLSPEEEAVVESLLAFSLAHRVGSGTFDDNICGNASLETCAKAYRVALSATPAAAADRACAGQRDSQSLARAGARPYALGSEKVAQMAWSGACADRAEIGRLFDFNTVFGVTAILGTPRPPRAWGSSAPKHRP